MSISTVDRAPGGTREPIRYNNGLRLSMGFWGGQ